MANVANDTQSVERIQAGMANIQRKSTVDAHAAPRPVGDIYAQLAADALHQVLADSGMEPLPPIGSQHYKDAAIALQTHYPATYHALVTEAFKENG